MLVNKEILTDKDVLPEKHLLEKAAPRKRIQYSVLGSELKKQTDIADKQYKSCMNLMKE